MSDEEEEYEVELIDEAKVEKSNERSRNAKLLWKYHVRWKGYAPEDDTWEPIESFQGSEHIVAAFWERANIGERDVDDMTQFKAGETFRPVGPPPRKKRKRLPSTPDVSKDASIADLDVGGLRPGPSEIDLPHEDLHPPLKRLREEKWTSPLLTSPSFPSSVTRPLRPQGRRPPSPEIIPDSDEEKDSIQAYLSPNRQKRDVVVSESSKVVEAVDTDETFDPLFDEPRTKIPVHISRRENPLVKMVVSTGADNLQGAIAAKVRALREPNVGSSSQAPPRVKPGPGRSSGGLLLKQKAKSSLFTAEKGAVKIIKGKYRKEAAGLQDQEPRSPILPDIEPFPSASKEDSSKAVPSGDELLELAGLDQSATDLADFEDPKLDDGIPVDNKSATDLVIQPVQTSESAGANGSSVFGSGSIFPQPGLSLVPSSARVFGQMHSWNRSTIFGPLSLGSDSMSKLQQHESPSIFLNLDSAVSIPAVFVTAPSSNSAMPTLIGGSKGTPGKFYGKESALTLLGTLRASGLTAQVTVDDSATVEEREHFRHFSARLQFGDIFVAVAGVHILVFSSSSNGFLSQRLNVSPAFQNVPSNTILVSKVDVENYSGYADATSQADGRRWVQYVATLS